MTALHRALALCLLVPLGCGGSTDPGGGSSTESPGAGQNWNLVVVLLDALPATGLGAWGYARPVSPNLDAFAEEAVRFDQAYASASYTLASISSIFTGHAPATHGVVGLDSNVLEDGHTTLAEALAARGFKTAGFSANPHITPEGGFAQGFETFQHYKRARLDKHVVQKTLERDALAWWHANEGARRFLYVHVLPPHQPYDPPAPHDGMFGAGETDRRLGMTDWLVAADKERSVKPGSPEARAIRARYDAGVHHADAFFGRFRAEVMGGGADANTVFCLLSDHGEAFGEHGRLLHGTTVFDEMIHVPLILDWPGAEPSVVEELVATRDLGATLCQLLDVPWPGDPRRSFLGAVFGDLEDREVLSRSVGNVPMWSLRTNEWSLLHQPGKGVRLLFDRNADRAETIDLLQLEEGWRQRSTGRELSAEELADLGLELQRTLKAHLTEHRRAGAGFERRADETHRDEIEGLGYADLETD